MDTTHSKSTRTPWATTADLTVVCQRAEDRLVAQWNEDHSVVHKRTDSVDDGLLLSTALSRSRAEDTGVLTPVRACGPLATGLVPEYLGGSQPSGIQHGL